MVSKRHPDSDSCDFFCQTCVCPKTRFNPTGSNFHRKRMLNQWIWGTHSTLWCVANAGFGVDDSSCGWGPSWEGWRRKTYAKDRESIFGVSEWQKGI